MTVLFPGQALFKIFSKASGKQSVSIFQMNNFPPINFPFILLQYLGLPFFFFLTGNPTL